jgi:hypothetical protein
MHISTVNVGGLFLIEFVFIEHLLSGFIGMTLWKNKGGDPSGAFILCAILGILGVVILAIGKPGRKEIDRVARSQGLMPCPNCAELINRQARVCAYCGRDVAPATGSQP